MNGKQLKNSILQWAIQGKLVPQDPNDEPASALLERIRAEKARLVKEGKIKKDKNESIIFRGDDNSHYEKFTATGEVRCIDDEIPFDIPDTWCWVRLGELISTQTGLAYSKPNLEIKSPKMVRVLRGGNISNGSWQVKANDVMISSEFVKVNLYLRKGYFITPAVTSWENLGKTALVREDYNDIVVGGFVLMMCPFYTDSVIEEYLNDFFQSVLFQQYCRNITNKSGQAFYNLSRSKLLNLLIPIPPKEEQERIITKCNELFPIIEKYGVAQNKLDTLNSEIKSILKKSILQEAIQGRLVEQCETDEPVSKLLERIQEEKRQLVKQGKLKAKDLTNSTIFRGDDNKYYEKCGNTTTCIDDEIPFEIPNSWCWVRLGDIFSHCTGKALNASNKGGVAYKYITTSNVYWNRFELSNLKSMPFKDNELEKCTATKGDLLVCEGGDIGRAAIWDYDYDIKIQNHIHKLRAYYSINTLFMYNVIFVYKHCGIIGGKGIGIQGLSSKVLHNILLPLPPLAEQQRIVDKVEQALASIMSR